MKRKSLKFTIFCAVFSLITQTKAQTAKCDYSFYDHLTLGYKDINASYYNCNLDTSQANHDSKLTRIDGQHVTGYCDAHVQWIGKSNSVTKLKTFSSIFCKKFPNLEEIDMNDLELESIDVDSLSSCQNLNHLLLNNNKLRVIPVNLLCRNSKLTKIRLHNNQLTTLPGTLFMSQKELVELYLYENHISFLPSSTFHPLVKLELLYLNENNFQSINPEWFRNLQNLKLLSLYGNKITEVPSKCFTALKNLTELWLLENKIKTLNPDSFDSLQNLQLLNLNSNEVSELPADCFASLTNLLELTMNNNKLTTIHSDSFGTHSQLRELNLQNNRIKAVDEKLIDNNDIKILNMIKNICSQMRMTTWSEIKLNLQKCFDNYEPRSQPQSHADFIFPLFRNLRLTSNQNSCGKSFAGVGNIIGGSHIARGIFPWIAALVMPTGSYFCGGTLISSRKVLTAAHCIQDKQAAHSKSAGEFLVLLGVYDLKNFIEIGRIPHAVQKVIVHPDWNPLIVSFDADIAVLILDREVGFSEYIQPICLVSLRVMNITTGVVVGYGKSEDETKIHETIPKVIATPIHTNEHCFLEYSNLVKISSKRTFCGGSGTGVGVCRGDSGSGLFVNDGSAYYLRGIVSSSIIGGRYGCDVDSYSVFTDVAKYVDWINGLATF